LLSERSAKRGGFIDNDLARYGALVLVLVALVYIWMPRGRVYPQLSERAQVEWVKRLYVICSQRDSTGLRELTAKVEEQKAAGKLPEEHFQGFARVIRLAEAEKWAAAQKAALRFAEDQLNR
jgi:hypothetical protein